MIPLIVDFKSGINNDTKIPIPAFVSFPVVYSILQIDLDNLYIGFKSSSTSMIDLEKLLL